VTAELPYRVSPGSAAHGETSTNQLRMTISTRRLCCRPAGSSSPSAVWLGVNGSPTPTPWLEIAAALDQRRRQIVEHRSGSGTKFGGVEVEQHRVRDADHCGAWLGGSWRSVSRAGKVPAASNSGIPLWLISAGPRRWVVTNRASLRSVAALGIGGDREVPGFAGTAADPAVAGRNPRPGNGAGITAQPHNDIAGNSD